MKHATQTPIVLCPMSNFKPCRGLACAWNLGGECAVHTLGYLCAATEAMASQIAPVQHTHEEAKEK